MTIIIPKHAIHIAFGPHEADQDTKTIALYF